MVSIRARGTHREGLVRNTERSVIHMHGVHSVNCPGDTADPLRTVLLVEFSHTGRNGISRMWDCCADHERSPGQRELGLRAVGGVTQ